jgi:hypothetical protein
MFLPAPRPRCSSARPSCGSGTWGDNAHSANGPAWPKSGGPSEEGFQCVLVGPERVPGVRERGVRRGHVGPRDDPLGLAALSGTARRRRPRRRRRRPERCRRARLGVDARVIITPPCIFCIDNQ